jgi:hypothetical protein
LIFKLILQFEDIMSNICLDCGKNQRSKNKKSNSNHNNNNNNYFTSKMTAKERKDYDIFQTKYSTLIKHFIEKWKGFNRMRNYFRQNANTLKNRLDIETDKNNNNLQKIKIESKQHKKEKEDEEEEEVDVERVEDEEEEVDVEIVEDEDEEELADGETMKNRANLIVCNLSDIINSLSQLVSCIGCRTSAERFYKLLTVQQDEIANERQRTNKINSDESHISELSALYPLVINVNGDLTICESLTKDPLHVYQILNTHGKRLNNILSLTASKSKKNRRCHLHSLDGQKQRAISDWIPVWDAFISDECRKKCLMVDTSRLILTLDNYLKKHKFCGDCKMKVIRAYHILVGEVESTKEKTYSPDLYKGLHCCSLTNKSMKQLNEADPLDAEKLKYKFHLQHQHIHVDGDKEFIKSLISRAEPEIHGNRRERHAKTLDIAQQEVLTCIGIYLYERFHRIFLGMRAEEQTWQLLLFTGIHTLKNSFEVTTTEREDFSIQFLKKI